MKKPKANTKSKETTGDDSNVKWLISNNDLDFLTSPFIMLPAAEQLTMIAATLGRNRNDNPDSLADAAMNLWSAAMRKISIAYDNVQKYEDEQTELNYLGPFPCTRDEFLERVLPQYAGRTADLARLGKAFQRHILRNKNKKEPTLEEVAAAYGKWKPYENLDQALPDAKRFDAWHKQYVTEARRAAGMVSAQVKQRRKKKRKARPPREKLKEIATNFDDTPLT
jgi:hypothetical protein